MKPKTWERKEAQLWGWILGTDDGFIHSSSRPVGFSTKGVRLWGVMTLQTQTQATNFFRCPKIKKRGRKASQVGLSSLLCTEITSQDRISQTNKMSLNNTGNVPHEDLRISSVQSHRTSTDWLTTAEKGGLFLLFFSKRTETKNTLQPLTLERLIASVSPCNSPDFHLVEAGAPPVHLGWGYAPTLVRSGMWTTQGFAAIWHKGGGNKKGTAAFEG